MPVLAINRLGMEFDGLSSMEGRSLLLSTWGILHRVRNHDPLLMSVPMHSGDVYSVNKEYAIT